MIGGVVLKKFPPLTRPELARVLDQTVHQDIKKPSCIHYRVEQHDRANSFGREAAPNRELLWKRVPVSHVLGDKRGVLGPLNPYLAVLPKNDMGLVTEQNARPISLVPLLVLLSQSKSLIGQDSRMGTPRERLDRINLRHRGDDGSYVLILSA